MDVWSQKEKRVLWICYGEPHGAGISHNVQFKF